MKVYLDNCCFNRPFDDQSQIRIQLEAHAKLYVQDQIKKGKIELVWSYILDYENSFNLFEERKNLIQKWEIEAKQYIVENAQILEIANNLSNIGLKSKDALHVACAVESNCDYFLTTDDKILKKLLNYSKIKVVNPLTFIANLND
ncbi:MAG: PIN domain-containing protein [Bacteroidetes bacterium]|jgi:predicted nucleic acid-binding protein|nr:PIN domain-containing protein [Bacteroidota bacterium]MBT7491314.1 PIN domain-containing protein [Bacteroidota bacterium]